MYMGPEMLCHCQSGPYSDLWALGVLAFQLYYKGKHPFAKDDSDYDDLLEAIKRGINFDEFEKSEQG